MVWTSPQKDSNHKHLITWTLKEMPLFVNYKKILTTTDVNTKEDHVYENQDWNKLNMQTEKSIHWINYSLFLVMLASKGGWSGHGDSSVRFCQWSKWCRKKWHAEIKFVMITKALSLCIEFTLSTKNTAVTILSGW